MAIIIIKIFFSLIVSIILFTTLNLQEMGAKCHKLEIQNTRLQRKIAEKAKENLDRIALNPNAVSP